MFPRFKHLGQIPKGTIFRNSKRSMFSIGEKNGRRAFMNKGDLFNTICEQYSDEDMKVSLILAKISAKLSAKRLELQMNQKQFAKYLNVSQTMVSKWEKGDYNFTIATLINIFGKLNMDLDIQLSEHRKKIVEKNSEIILFPTQKWEVKNKICRKAPSAS